MTARLFAVHGLVSFTLAILVLFLGNTLVQHSTLLRQYRIPESVVGGFVCAAVTSRRNFQVEFDLQVRDTMLPYFFAGIGLKSDMRQLIKGGRPLLILLVLAAVFIFLQNALGMTRWRMTIPANRQLTNLGRASVIASGLAVLPWDL